MKTILVLGGFGFIGSNLLQYVDDYKLNAYRVIVFDRKQNHPFGLKFKCVSKIYKGDFSNREHLEVIFQDNKIDEVFHFLNTTVPATSSNIKFDIESNLVATIGLLELVEQYLVKKFIFISSGGAIYGDTNLNNLEAIDTFPLSSYGIVKLAIEKYIHMFCKRSNISYLILRLSNPFGRFHYSESQGIVNIALRKTLRQEPVTVWGDGTGTKDYLFIEDFIQVLMLLLDNAVDNEVINIGSGQLYSVNQILEIIESFEPSLRWSYTDKKEFDNIHFQFNTNKLRKYIGDYEFTSIDIGIENTLKWLKGNTLL
jgi:UDP-glucose 4-epimerase